VRVRLGVQKTETKRKLEDLSIALEEASVVEKDLRLQLERERVEQEQLLATQQQSLHGEVAGSHTEAVAASFLHGSQRFV